MKLIIVLCALIGASCANAEMACISTDVTNVFTCRETIETAGQYIWSATAGRVYADPNYPQLPWRQYYDCARSSANHSAYVTVDMPLWPAFGLSHTHPVECAATESDAGSRLVWNLWDYGAFIGCLVNAFCGIDYPAEQLILD